MRFVYNNFKYNNLESKIMAYEHLKDKDVKAWLMEMPQEKNQSAPHLLEKA